MERLSLKDKPEDQPVYSPGLYRALQNGRFKFTEVEPQMRSLLHYTWMFPYELKDVEEKQVFVISAETEQANGKQLLMEEFVLDKKEEKQEFSISVEKVWSSALDEIEVFLNLNISEIGYPTSKWGTEVNLKSRERTHDVVISVGETKFYVLRSYLATWSRHFDSLFFGSFKEKNQSEIKLKEVDADLLNQLLRLIHPGLLQSLHEGNVLEILKMADRFDIPNIMACCGVCYATLELKLIDRLELSDRHNLVDLLVVCFTRIHSMLAEIRNNCKELKLIDRLELSDRHNLVDLLVVCFTRIHSMLAEIRSEFLKTNRRRIQELSTNTIKNII